MSALTFGSVCSGIEAASVAWHPLGWRAAWLAEIEAFPAAVLAHHYPDVPNLGDMTKIAAMVRAGQVAAPDVLVGGTPCQAFSVAGLRKSLDDARGQLSLSFVDLANAIDAARAVRGDPAAIVVWENVPGVTSTKDNAFGCFLGALAGEDDALVPPGGKWANAGCVLGPERTVAWRITDAQYFGVAQRRRRCFVVASAREGFDPTQVLFELEGVQRHSAPSRETRQDAAAGTLRSTGGGCDVDHARAGHLQPITSALTTCCGEATNNEVDSHMLVTVMAHGQGGTEISIERCPTLTCNHEAPIAAYAFQPRIARNGRGDMGDLVNALTAQAGETGKGDAAPCVAYAIQAGALRENPASGPDGVGVQETIAYTLEARAEVQAVAFSCKDHGADASVGIAPTMRAMGHSGSHANAGGQLAVAYANAGHFGGMSQVTVSDPLRAKGGDTGNGGETLVAMSFKASHYTRGKDGAPSELAPPLSADADKGDQDTLILAPTIYTSDGVVADPISANEGKTYTHEGTSFRLHNCIGEPFVAAFAENSRGELRLEGGDGSRTGTLSVGGGKPGQGTPTIALSVTTFQERGRTAGRALEVGGDVAYALTAPSGGGRAQERNVQVGMAVRRLIPRECERLQAFPDDYTLITYRNKPAADGPRYKALGNSMCVNNMRWIGERIEAVLAMSAPAADIQDQPRAGLVLCDELAVA
jgi:DNA (cytosine-5)-methyltransferase 1